MRRAEERALYVGRIESILERGEEAAAALALRLLHSMHAAACKARRCVLSSAKKT
jgi:hypothetical protein